MRSEIEHVAKDGHTTANHHQSTGGVDLFHSVYIAQLHIGDHDSELRER